MAHLKLCSASQGCVHGAGSGGWLRRACMRRQSHIAAQAVWLRTLHRHKGYGLGWDAHMACASMRSVLRRMGAWDWVRHTWAQQVVGVMGGGSERYLVGRRGCCGGVWVL